MTDEMTLASNLQIRNKTAAKDTSKQYLHETIARLQMLSLDVVVASPIPQTDQDTDQCLLLYRDRAHFFVAGSKSFERKFGLAPLFNT